MSKHNVNFAVAQLPEEEAPIQQNPNKLSGSPTIGGYRVQAETLVDYFAEGLTLEDFLEDFEGTPKQDVLVVLSLVRQAIRDGLLTNLQVRDENLYQFD